MRGDYMASEIAKIVGERIRIHRKEQNISQEELAFRAGLHPTYIGQVERGEKNATLESIEKIILALSISFETLFMGIQFENEDKQCLIIEDIQSLLNCSSPKKLKFLHQFIKLLIEWHKL